MGTAVLAALAASAARDAVDWQRVDLWWGDERFLPSGHPDRNETQARDALLDAVPIDPAPKRSTSTSQKPKRSRSSRPRGDGAATPQRRSS
jgi:6-phosphogluconolactonase